MKIKDLIDEGNKVLHKDQTKLVLGTILNLNPLELNFHLEDIVTANLENKFKRCLENIKMVNLFSML